MSGFTLWIQQGLKILQNKFHMFIMHNFKKQKKQIFGFLK